MAQGWTGGVEGLRLGPLLVSFQRYSRPEISVVQQAPTSLGALPVAWAETTFLLPVANCEAFWIGALAEAPSWPLPLRVSAEDAHGQTAPILQLAEIGIAVGAGRPRDDCLFDALCPPVCVGLRIIAGGYATGIVVVTPGEYAARTGQPQPPLLDLDAGYKGWWLP